MKDLTAAASWGVDGPSSLTIEEQAKETSDLYYALRKSLIRNFSSSNSSLPKPAKGDLTSLNPMLLKDFYKLIFYELSETERASVAIYELQTYVLELAVKNK
jgi:hypothetical protein